MLQSAFLSLFSAVSKRGLAQLLALFVICSCAFLVRLFLISRFETSLNESESFFNYRSTQYLVENGVDDYLNWFDDKSWSPLGRKIGESTKPGVIFAAAGLHQLLNFGFSSFTLHETCVYFGPIIASFTCLSMFFLTRQVTNDAALPSLLSAAFLAFMPGFIQTSTAGKFGAACLVPLLVIALLLCWLKSVRSGSACWSGLASLVYFCSAATWDEHVFLANLVPIFVITQIAVGRFTPQLASAYSSFFLLGTLLSMQLSDVQFNPITRAEYCLPAFTFIYVLIYHFSETARTTLNSSQYQKASKAISALFMTIILAFLLSLQMEWISPLEDKWRALLNPTFSKSNVPLLASSNSNQPASWSAFFFDAHFGVLFYPVGLYIIAKQPTSEENTVVAVYALVSAYCSAVKIHYLLVFAPAVSILSAIVVAHFLQLFARNLCDNQTKPETKKQKEKLKAEQEQFPFKRPVSGLTLGVVCLYCVYTVRHSVWAAQNAYSDPSVVISANRKNGEKFYFDDFRESYSWLRQNTPEDSKILSWWDYGFNIATMADRATVVDNAAWNSTHIAQVGQIFAGSESESYGRIMALDADYVLVTFGGMVSWGKDDINKFLWMLRIAKTIPGGNYEEKEYKNPYGEFRVDIDGSGKWHNSVLYKLCYYRYGSMRVEEGKPDGWDRVRKAEIGNKDFALETMEEVYTSTHWLVRIYRVKKPGEQSVAWY